MAASPGTTGPPPPDSALSHENNGHFLLTFMGALTGFGLLFVAARVYCRLISQKRLFVEDFIVILTAALIIAHVAFAAMAVEHGAGRHMVALRPEQIQGAIFYAMVAALPGVMAFTLPKFAVVILLAKLLNPGRWHRIAMWVVSVVYFSSSVVTVIMVWVQCTPASTQWGAAKGRCWNPRVMFVYTVVHGACGAVFDLYLAIYPTVVMARMVQLTWKAKAALSSALGFGYCACAVAAYKCYTLSNLFERRDFTYKMNDIVLWTNIEGNCVLIGACIPTLYPLIKKLFGARALAASSTPQHLHIVTFGSHPKEKPPQPPHHHHPHLILHSNLEDSTTYVADADADDFDITPTTITNATTAATSHCTNTNTTLEVESGRGRGPQRWRYVVLQDDPETPPPVRVGSDGNSTAEQWAAETVARLQRLQVRVEQWRVGTPPGWI
ncbi:hypothetical protein C8A05DRAFT_13004 [Staphylotrichum tortipilum]|uniref:Rhodopsin domain-containing protein n=1 Tax=Staphylotrichum tortipilum TaxID=2831512 RepID=A0AAN6MQR8_9PEZI|nr:hypothetical protein C8A05DRAFT_13004 [Staphylotrichum longicolle]